MRYFVTLALLLLTATGSALGQAISVRPVGIIGITSEIGPIEARLRDSHDVTVRGFVFRQGTLGGRPVVVGRTGTGKVHAAIATTALITHFNPSAVLFSGTAGAADPGLRLGDVVIGTTVAHHDIGQQSDTGLQRRGPRHPMTGELDTVLLPAPEALVEAARRAARTITLPAMTTADGQHTPRVVEGVIVTGEMFVANVAQREELRRSLAASAIEMEGAAVIQTCRYFDVPCLVVRSVTDRADGDARTSYQTLRPAASENAAAVVAAIVGLIAPR